MNRDALQRGFAEFVGAFALVFVGAGSIVATSCGNLTAIASSDPRGAFRSIAGLAIGGTITLDIFMGVPIPARR